MRHNWEIDEEWATLHIFLTAVATLNEAMGDSSSSSIAARLGHFAALAEGGEASHSARQTREVWAEYANDPDGGVERALVAYEDVTGSALGSEGAVA